MCLTNTWNSLWFWRNAHIHVRLTHIHRLFHSNPATYGLAWIWRIYSIPKRTSNIFHIGTISVCRSFFVLLSDSNIILSFCLFVCSLIRSCAHISSQHLSVFSSLSLCRSSVFLWHLLLMRLLDDEGVTLYSPKINNSLWWLRLAGFQNHMHPHVLLQAVDLTRLVDMMYSWFFILCVVPLVLTVNMCCFCYHRRPFPLHTPRERNTIATSVCACVCKYIWHNHN